MFCKDILDIIYSYTGKKHYRYHRKKRNSLCELKIYMFSYWNLANTKINFFTHILKYRRFLVEYIIHLKWAGYNPGIDTHPVDKICGGIGHTIRKKIFRKFNSTLP